MKKGSTTDSLGLTNSHHEPRWDGNHYGTSDVTKNLSKASDPQMFLLATEKHAMMIGQKEGKFFFYDPNFALYQFDNITDLNNALTKHMKFVSKISDYETVGTAKNPKFRLIAL